MLSKGASGKMPSQERTFTERKKVMTKELQGTATVHHVVHLDVEVRQPYDEFCRRYETAVPPFNRDRAFKLVERKAAWPEVVADAALRRYTISSSTVNDQAQGNIRAHSRVMAIRRLRNDVIAYQIFGGPSCVTRKAPEADGRTRFAIDQPSTTLSTLAGRRLRKSESNLITSSQDCSRLWTLKCRPFSSEDEKLREGLQQQL
jgi:hypothetical protein